MTSPDDQEPSPLEYARYHSLALPRQPGDTDIGIEDIPHGLNLQAWLVDFDTLPDLDLRSSLRDIPEKLTLDAEGRLVLASMIRPTQELLNYNDIEKGYAYLIRKLKLELPLLSTDSESDFRNFLRQKQAASTFENIHHEPMCTDEEWEGGLSWSADLLDHSAQYEKQSRSEKLEVDREAFVWLQWALKADASDEEDLSSIETRHEHVKKSPLHYLTPPLSPVYGIEGVRESPWTPYNDYDLLSDHTSPNVYASKRLNETFMKEDDLQFPSNEAIFDELDAYLNNSDGLTLTSEVFNARLEKANSTSPNRRKAVDLKVEEFLTPPTSIQIHRSDQCSDDLAQLAIGLPLSSDNGRISNSQDDFDAFFNDVIEVEACKVKNELENELLQEADAMMRVEVPRLDFSIPTPPWRIPLSAKQEEEELREIMLPIAMMKLHHLPTPINERKLAWVPFPEKLGICAAEEEIHHYALVEELINSDDLGPDIDPETLSWKPDGWRILDESDDDGEAELTVGAFDTEPNLGALVRKRKFELANFGSDDPAIVPSNFDLVIGNPQLPIQPTATSRASHVMIQPCQPMHTTRFSGSKDTATKLGDVFSASDEITRFVEMQTGQISKKQKTMDAPAVILAGTSSAFTLDHGKNTRSADSKLIKKSTPHTPVTISNSEIVSGETLPVPGARVSQSASRTSRPIIVSSNLLSQQRQLIKTILAIDPSLYMISRDYQAWSPAHTSQPSPSKQPTQPAADREADVIISPSTGIILTSLQKIKQKPLPGQGEFSAIRQRILKVCPAYERVYLLVCVGAASPLAATTLQSTLESIQTRAHHQAEHSQDIKTHHPSSSTSPSIHIRDIEALASLVTFAATLSPISDVTVTFIPASPSHETSATARWIVGLLHVNPLPDLPLAGTRHTPRGCTVAVAQEAEWPLLQDETTWELVLRRAGMNAFASQAVLLGLREPSGDTEDADVRGPVAGPVFEKGSHGSADRGDASACGSEAELAVEGTVYGLSSFVLMTPAERRARLAGLMGGVKVLDRVGGLFDRYWGGKV